MRDPPRPCSQHKGGLRADYPAGMDPGIAHVRELARQFTPEAIETLVEIRGDPKQSGSARVAAANSLLDRGWGRPDQSVSIEHGQSLLSILDELERRSDMREVQGEVLDEDNETTNNGTVMQIEQSNNDNTS